MVASDANQQPDWNCSAVPSSMVVSTTSPGSVPVTPTTPPRSLLKSLTKKLDPPRERQRPFRKPPRVDVVMKTSPRIIAIASTQTDPPAGILISAKANAGPQLILFSWVPSMRFFPESTLSITFDWNDVQYRLFDFDHARGLPA